MAERLELSVSADRLKNSTVTPLLQVEDVPA